ncbi:MAG: CHAT domain-containing protein [Bacteroidales bacterium]|nr:CHAT domain-containing protein [Bacteroidales bacterium]
MGLFSSKASLFGILLWVIMHGTVCGQQPDYGWHELWAQAEALEDAGKYDSAMLIVKSMAEIANPSQIPFIDLKQANLYRELKEYPLAEEKLNNVVQSNHILQSDSLIWRDYYFISGKLEADKRNYEPAIQQLNRALSYTNKKDTVQFPLRARILNYMGITYHYMGRIDQALTYYLQAAELYEQANMHTLDLADVLQNIAIIYSLQSKFDNVLDYIQRAKDIREKLLEDDDSKMVAFYMNYSRILFITGDPSESLAYLRKAETILQSSNSYSKIQLGLVLNSIANVHLLNADYEKAATYFQNSIHLLKQEGESGYPHLLSAENNLALLYNQLGDYESTLKILIKNESIDMKAASKIRLYLNLARAYQGLDQTELAQKYYESSMQTAREHFGENHSEFAIVLQIYGDFWYRQHDYAQALKYYKQVRDISSRIKVRSGLDLAINFRKIGSCYRHLQRYEDASELFAEAERILTDHTGQQVFDDHVKLLFIDLYFDQGYMYQGWYNSTGEMNFLQLSLDAFIKGMHLMGEVGQSLTEEGQMELGENLHSGLMAAIQVAYELYQLSGDESIIPIAFEIAETSKAAVLRSSMQKHFALMTSGVPAEVIQKEKNLNQDLVSLTKMIEEEKRQQQVSEAKIAFYEEKKLKLMGSYDSLVHHIEQNFPDYYSLRYDMSVFTPGQIQKMLQPDELLIEYMVGETDLYSFALDKKTIVFTRIENFQHIEKGITTIRQQALQDIISQGREYFEQFVQLSNELYEYLISPVSAMIPNKRLILIPDGILNYLPFEILIKPSNSSKPTQESMHYASLPYILYEHPISYAYSSTLRYKPVNRKRRKAYELQLYVPDYEQAKAYQIDTLSLTPVMPLPFAKKEAERITTVWGSGTQFEESEASKQQFIHQAEHAHILHLSMHAIVDDENPLFSHLVFQPDSLDKASFELYTYELYGLRLNAAMAVLSACQTGVGKLREGEGVISLTRGFLYAGVPSIVMANWEVNDNAGAELMESFYTYLKKGYTRDKALQQAKIDYLESASMLKSHPFFWASYMLIGDNQVLDAKNTYGFLLYFVPLLLGIGIIYAYRTTKKSKEKPHTQS